MGKETIVALSYSHIIPFLHLCVFTYLHFYVFVFHLFTPLLSKIHLFYFLYSHPTPLRVSVSVAPDGLHTSLLRDISKP